MKHPQGISPTLSDRGNVFSSRRSVAFVLSCALAASLACTQVVSAQPATDDVGAVNDSGATQEGDRLDANSAAGKLSPTENSVPTGAVALPQTITFGPNPGPRTFVATSAFSVSATGGASGNPVVFTSLTASVCSLAVPGGSLAFVISAGTCVIAANQAGNSSYTAAPQVTQDIIIIKGPQTISFGANPGPVAFAAGGIFSVVATARDLAGVVSGPVSFTSLTTGICTVSANTVSILAAGICTIAADQAGDTNYNSAPQVTQDVSITSPASQTIIFEPPAQATYFCCALPSYSLIASGGGSGNPVTFTSLTPGVCFVNSGAGGFFYAFGGAGTCTIAADQAGDTNYLAAARVVRTTVINKLDQALAFGPNPGPLTYPAGTFGVSATLTSAGTGGTTGPITYASLTPNVCTSNGPTITVVFIGTCTISANIAGNANINPAPQVTQDVIINPFPSSVGFGAAPRVVVGGTGNVIAVGGLSPAPITLTSLTPAICTITGSTVSGIEVGTCTIAADQAAITFYAAAPRVTQSFTIAALASQTIVFGPNPGPITNFYCCAWPLPGITATGGASGNPVIFTSLTEDICLVTNQPPYGFAARGAGTCTIAANQAGNAFYLAAAQVTQDIIINKTNQTLLFGANPGPVSFATNATFSIAVTVITSGFTFTAPITTSSLTPSVCTVNGMTVTIVSVGTCTIAANRAGDANYNPAPQVTQNIDIFALTISSVVSRKQHAGVDRNIVIDHTVPITGNIGTEPRAIGTGHQIVFQFSGAVTQPGFAGAVDSALFDIGTATANVNPLANNEVIVTLTGIPDNKRVTISLLNVNSIASPFSASLGFLVGDVNGNLSVNSSDISGVKARSGQVTDASNFRFDVNANGTINSSDISAVKARSGATLAP